MRADQAADRPSSSHFAVAWLQLMDAKGRFLAATAGIAFTVIFSMLQLAFLDALFTSVTLLYSHLNADLILIGPRYQCIVATSNFPKRRLYQARAFDEVQSVSAMYVSIAPWKNPVNGHDREIFIIGATPQPRVFDYPSVNAHWRELSEPGKVMFDEGSRPEFGPVPQLFREGREVITELAHRRVEVVGIFRIGANFANDGNILTGDANFFRLVPFRDSDAVDIGVVALKPGVDPESVRRKMTAALPADVTVLTKEGLLDREKAFFGASLPVGFFFQMSVVIGLVVGAVIVYQILYNDVLEHLPEYATLKAIGLSNRYLFGIVLRKAVTLSAVGFVPGLLLSMGTYEIARWGTMLPIRMTLPRILFVYLLTLIMCTSSGLLAMQKLRHADPADIF